MPHQHLPLFSFRPGVLVTLLPPAIITPSHTPQLHPFEIMSSNNKSRSPHNHLRPISDKHNLGKIKDHYPYIIMNKSGAFGCADCDLVSYLTLGMMCLWKTQTPHVTRGCSGNTHLPNWTRSAGICDCPGWLSRGSFLLVTKDPYGSDWCHDRPTRLNYTPTTFASHR